MNFPARSESSHLRTAATGLSGPCGLRKLAQVILPGYGGYYRDYSNSTLWPVLHSWSERMSRTEEGYDTYRQMNNFIARAAFGLGDRDAFWVHDSHLFPLAADLHKLGIERPTGFFLRTPRPTPDIIERVPNHRELMKSMLEHDLLGFQTNRGLTNFLACLRTYFGLESEDCIVTTERGARRDCKNSQSASIPSSSQSILPQTSRPQSKKISPFLRNFEGAKFAIGGRSANTL
ncbi:trehalose-6-phosphate synthase [Bradyrhizobium japonicum]